MAMPHERKEIKERKKTKWKLSSLIYDVEVFIDYLPVYQRLD